MARDEFAERMLAEHLDLGIGRAISYLPTRTIRSVLRLTIGAYRELADANGLDSVVVPARQSPIRSGTVHVFHRDALSIVLDQHRTRLAGIGWQSSVDAFVEKVSREWLDDDHPAMPAVKAAFGERPCPALPLLHA